MKTFLIILAVILGTAWGVTTAICAVKVLVMLFTYEGMVKGIIGILIGPYTFIWGWINAKRLGLMKVMIVWSVMLMLWFGLIPIISVVLYLQRKSQFMAEAAPNNRQPSDSSNQLIVLVDERGGLKFNGQELGLSSDTGQLRAKLVQALREHMERRSDRTVVVRASRKLPYGEMAKVIAAVREAGGDPVKLEKIE